MLEDIEEVEEELDDDEEEIEEVVSNTSQVMASSEESDSEEMLVDSGATSHINNDESNFSEFDETFVPEQHSVTLADGTKASGMALKRGKVDVTFTDTKGKSHDVTLNDVLYIPTYPQNMFSVSRAVEQNSSVVFHSNFAELITHDGTKFKIQKEGRLFWLRAGIRRRSASDSVNSVRDLKDWHSVLGHCNKADILKLEPLVDGMKIANKEELNCTPCILGKHTNNISKGPSERAKAPLEMVSSDVCGPITPVSADGFRYVISFIDNYSGFMFVYFLKKKSDATKALLKFIADVSPFGKINKLLNLTPQKELEKLRSDGGGEYMGKEFKDALIENHIRHEQSSPYSPHQNGVAERGWRTLFDMARCMLLESELPKLLWPYAIMTAAYVRNRCYQRRLNQTAYFAMTGRKPNLGNMFPFGSTCFVYDVQPKSKLDPRSKQGVFLGYDRESPAYLVYFPDTGKVVKRRNVKFVAADPCRNSGGDDDDFPGEVLLPTAKPTTEPAKTEVAVPKTAQVKPPVSPDVRPREPQSPVLPVGNGVPQQHQTPLVRSRLVPRPILRDSFIPQPENDIFDTPVTQPDAEEGLGGKGKGLGGWGKI